MSNPTKHESSKDRMTAGVGMKDNDESAKRNACGSWERGCISE